MDKLHELQVSPRSNILFKFSYPGGKCNARSQPYLIMWKIRFQEESFEGARNKRASGTRSLHSLINSSYAGNYHLFLLQVSV